MGKALYRKYRSRSFGEVIGQEHITDTLKNAIAKGAISHAYLFTGPKGVGKTSIARILAHEINNLPYSEDSTHLDIIEIDAASNRRIDEIRDLRDKVHIAPTSAKYKVYIIDEVHMLTREAFNALLKTLEEPPEHAVFILATTEAHKVPDTIVSRTQKFTFKPIDSTKAIQHLKSIAKLEGVVIDDAALKLLAEHGGGSFRDSISMLDQLSGMKKKSLTLEDAQMLLGIPNEQLIDAAVSAYQSNTISDIFESIQSMRENGIDSGKAAIYIGNKLRTILLDTKDTDKAQAIVRTLKYLLPLTLTSSDFVSLELALLDSSDGSSTASKSKMGTKAPSIIHSPTENIITSEKRNNEDNSFIPVPPKTENEAKTELVATKEIANEAKLENEHINEPKPKKKSINSTANFSPELWNELLNELKSKHNTLYGILRMAEAKQDEEGIELLFNFGFHKKQVDSPKNNAILREFIMQYFGSGAFVTKIDSTKQPAKNSKNMSAKATNNNPTTIESVSNIFGGAELLE